MEPKFTLRRSIPDPRDYIYAQRYTVDPSQIPSRMMLHDTMKFDTQLIGDCTGESGRTAYGIYLHGQVDVSPDFFYAQEKLLDGQPNVEGSQLRFLMQVMNKIGGCERSLYPQITSNSQIPTSSQEALNDAATRKIGEYNRIQTLNEIKHAISVGNPVIIGVLCCDNFVNNDNGFIDVPQGSILGGHAITIIGYDDNLEHTFASGITRKGFLKIKNSWGAQWGDQGYGWICYDFLTNYIDPFGYGMMEAWTITPAFPVVQPKKVITIRNGDTNAMVNGQAVALDQPATIINGHMMVPIRFISEQLGENVDYNAATGEVTITEY